MNYKIVRLKNPAYSNGKRCDFDVDRYYATHGSREPTASGPFPDPFIEVWADGSLTLHHRDSVVFLYDDQWRGILMAVEAALKDKEDDRRKEREQWLAETEDETIFSGIKVDLTRREVLAALASCPIETEAREGFGGWTAPFITYMGERRSLGRTDLMDDVATGLCENKTAEQWREHYLNKAKSCLGARLRAGRFSVIDSYTDG